MKKKWTPAARAAFARKMKAARLAKRGGRTKNPKRPIAESKARDADSPMQKGHNDGRSGKSSNPPKKKADADEYMKGYNVGAHERRNEVANRPRGENARRRVRASMRFVVYQKSRNRKTTVRRFEDLAPAKTFARGYAKEHPYVAVMVQRI
jgi:hypothetical protein